MYIIEPCCANRHLRILLDSIGNSGTALFEGYGDLSLTELMPALMTRYSETEMLICTPTLPEQAADVIEKWMKRQWACKEGNGKLEVIRHLTVITGLSYYTSPTVSAWIKDNLFGERLTIQDIKQTETAILLPDLAIIGPVNVQYGKHFVATITSRQNDVDALWKQYKKLEKL